MKPKQFIEKAIEGGMRDEWGGWKNFEPTLSGFKFHDEDEYFPLCPGTTYSLAEIVLNPLAWQAVGKVEGWEWGTKDNPAIIDYQVTFAGYLMKVPPVEEMRTDIENKIEYDRNKNISAVKLEMLLRSMTREVWRYNMHRMIDALIEGKTVEEFISTL